MKTKIEVVGEKDIWYWSAKRNGYVVASSVKKCRSKSALLRTLKSFLASIEKGDYEIEK